MPNPIEVLQVGKCAKMPFTTFTKKLTKLLDINILYRVPY
jgi:hypothetical protein